VVIAKKKFAPPPILLKAKKFKPYQFPEVFQGKKTGVKRGGGESQ